MARTLFGTDGIRGKANAHPITAEVALAAAKAAGAEFRRGGYRHRVVIGKDTRLSGYLLEAAMTAGFISVGMDVIQLGPLPTPAVGMLTRSLRADLGVMISASHNPYYDNGIKIFGPDGFKLSDEVEARIEARIAEQTTELAKSEALGRAQQLEDGIGRYIEFVKQSFPKDLTLNGLKLVVDCANGAAYKVAPAVLHELGAEVIPIAVSPNGFNINKECGATHVASMREAVVMHGAHLGIALDGDADRVIVADETGETIDGDRLMGVIAATLHRDGRLRGGGLVATVMSNLGLEQYLQGLGLSLRRTKVGDRYVVEAMRSEGYNVGGEQSGHIVLSDFTTTGDGLIAALQVLAAIMRVERPASQVMRPFDPMPQLLKSVRIESGAAEPLEAPLVKSAISDAEASFNGRGRVLIRKSGTEPVIRVMAEGDDKQLVTRAVDDICHAIQQVA